MKDVTTTSFGLVAAYLLPGVLGLYTLSLWSTQVEQFLKSFMTAQSSFGLFFFVSLLALIIGVELTAIRWVVFELGACRNIRLLPADFAGMTSQDKASAFAVAIDENYRYHQFFGALSIVIPIMGVSLARRFGFPTMGVVLLPTLALQHPRMATYARACWWTFGFLILEAVTVAAAIEAYRRYVARAQRILKGEQHA